MSSVEAAQDRAGRQLHPPVTTVEELLRLEGSYYVAFNSMNLETAAKQVVPTPPAPAQGVVRHCTPLHYATAA